jgi:hypothetical protein
VTRWPGGRGRGEEGASPDLLAQLADVPGATAVCASVVAGAIRQAQDEGGPLGARVLIRVAAPREMATRCLRHLRASARRLRVSVVRLDGEQAPTVYATMPTAATDGWDRSW